MIAWLLAAILMVTALLKLKETAKDPRASYAAPIAYFLAALILANIEQSINIGTQSINVNSSGNAVCGNNQVIATNSCFSAINPEQMAKIREIANASSSMAGEEDAVKALIYLIKIIGFIYFIYGVMLIPKLSEPGSQITTIKPILHIIFSSLLINLPSIILS
jgi:hypothetical protein